MSSQISQTERVSAVIVAAAVVVGLTQGGFISPLPSAAAAAI